MVPDGEVPEPMQEETNAHTVNRFIRRPDVYRRLMRIYHTAREQQPDSVAARVCQTKTGLGTDEVCLAHRDSTPDNVMCPHGFRNSFKWPFCCVRNGVSENIRDVPVSTTVQGDYEPPTKTRRTRTEFGRMYKRLRPHATDTIIHKKYKAYLKVLEHFRELRL